MRIAWVNNACMVARRDRMRFARAAAPRGSATGRPPLSIRTHTTAAHPRAQAGWRHFLLLCQRQHLLHQSLLEGARRCRCAQARVLAHGQVAPPATMLHAHHLCNALRRVAQRGLVESTHKWRALAARSNTDRPRASVTIMLAPTPRSACATVSAPFFKTMCSGVWPRLFIESAMAPAARSSLTTSTWPRRARAAG
jgi:hypothetical protein